MMVLVVGGSGSGKSSYAEKVTVSLAQESVKEITKSENTSLSDFKLNIAKKYYLATMQVLMTREGKRLKDIGI